MSYDLMVFEPEAAPKGHAAFMDWYSGLTKWDDGPYDDVARTSLRLRAWVEDMQRTFPDMNGPEAAAHLPADEGTLGDYSIGRQFVYAVFAWSKAVTVSREAERLARLHKVGLFDVSSVGQEVYFPVAKGMELAHKKKHSPLGRLRGFLGG